MIVPIFLAFTAGLLVILSRQINGRLSLSTTPLMASFFNHLVGFAFLTLIGIATGGLIPSNASDIPWWIYLGGPLGVIFVAAGSWLITRIGAINSTLLVISGQMVSGVILDYLRGMPVTLWASVLGVVLIFAGMTLTQRRR
jgi:transporter family-2 protein